MGSRPLLVTNDFPPDVGGIQRFALEIATRLPGAAVLAPGNPAGPEHDRALDVPVKRAPVGFLGPGPRSVRAVVEAAGAHRADVVLFLSPVPLALLGRHLDVPWGVVAHGAEVEIPGRVPVAGRAVRRALRSATGLFAVSQWTASRLARLLGPRRPPVRLLRNGVDLDRFGPGVDGRGVRRRLGLGDAPIVTCVGRLVPRKGQDQLVSALPAIRERVPGTRLVLVGDGRLRGRLENRARSLPPGSVVLTGSVSNGELPALHAAADVFAHPNRTRWGGLEQEGFGIVFLEAQASGVPVVAGESGGAPEALVDGRTGLVVDGSDSGAVAAAVGSLLADPSRRQEMGARGRRLVTRHFAWDRIVEQLAEDLAVLAAAPAPAPRR